MARSFLEEFVESPEDMRLFQQERAITEITELICKVMERQGVTRTKLAELLRTTKGYVTQLLDGEANKTIRTVADVLAVLGMEFQVSAGPIKIGECLSASASADLSEYGWAEPQQVWNPRPILRLVG